MEPGRRVSGAQVVYETLRQRISTLELAPGTRLHEVELSKALAVSRTPLREALKMLMAERLVEQLPTGGVVVAPLDPARMRDLYVVRAALEGVAAAEACRRAGEDDLAVLAQLVDQMSRMLDLPAEMLRLGQAFHARVLATSGNRHCEDMLRTVRGHLDRYKAVTAGIEPRRHDAYREHAEILDALRGGDPDRTEQLMRAHILAAYVEGAPFTQPAQPGQQGSSPAPASDVARSAAAPR